MQHDSTRSLDVPGESASQFRPAPLNASPPLVVDRCTFLDDQTVLVDAHHLLFPLGTSFWPPSGKAVTTPPSVLIATTQFSPCDPALPLLRTTSLRGPRTSRRCPRRPRPRTRRASKALLPSPSSTCWLTSYVNYSNTRLCPYLRAWRSGYHCTEVESASPTSLCPTSSGTEHFLSRQLAEIYHGSRPGFSAR